MKKLLSIVCISIIVALPIALLIREATSNTTVLNTYGPVDCEGFTLTVYFEEYPFHDRTLYFLVKEDDGFSYKQEIFNDRSHYDKDDMMNFFASYVDHAKACSKDVFK